MKLGIVLFISIFFSFKASGQIIQQEWDGDILYQRKDTLSKVSTYLVADAYFSKRSFPQKVRSMQKHLK